MKPHPLLDRSENRILGLLCAGRGPRRIAKRLGIGVHTVRAHIVHIRGKLGADSIARLRVGARHLGRRGE
jgi:DNA-binding CsgD family transcriptional regulator